MEAEGVEAEGRLVERVHERGSWQGGYWGATNTHSYLTRRLRRGRSRTTLPLYYSTTLHLGEVIKLEDSGGAVPYHRLGVQHDVLVRERGRGSIPEEDGHSLAVPQHRTALPLRQYHTGDRHRLRRMPSHAPPVVLVLSSVLIPPPPGRVLPPYHVTPMVSRPLKIFIDSGPQSMPSQPSGMPSSLVTSLISYAGVNGGVNGGVTA